MPVSQDAVCVSGASEVLSLGCDSCGARICFETGQRTTRCPFCDTALVVDRPAIHDRPQPVFALGFTIDRDSAVKAVRQWLCRQKLRPSGMNAAAAQAIAGIYLPCYLYSAAANSGYQAGIAENYTRLAVDKDGAGIRSGTEYRDFAGRHATYVSDILVTASRGVSNDELQAIEPFDLSRLCRYSPGIIAGWNSEEPSLSTQDCLRLGRVEGDAAVAALLRDFMPGDGVATLSHSTEFTEESLDHTLVPVWVLAIRDHPQKPPVRILVNGQTGKVGGKLPHSKAKLGVLIVAGFLALAALFMLLSKLWRHLQ